MASAIGPYEVLTISGMPQTIRQQLEIVQRSGVDGSGIYLTGLRGRPFTLRTTVDGIGRINAFLAFEGYTQLVGAEPVGIVHGGVWIGTINALFAVLDVRLVDIGHLALSVGGTTAGADTLLTAEWDFLPVHSQNSG